MAERNAAGVDVPVPVAFTVMACCMAMSICWRRGMFDAAGGASSPSSGTGLSESATAEDDEFDVRELADVAVAI